MEKNNNTIFQEVVLEKEAIVCDQAVSGEMGVTALLAEQCPADLKETSSNMDSDLRTIEPFVATPKLKAESQAYIPKSFIIGITGVSRAGKTTLATMLIPHFDKVEVIHQDNFFFKGEKGRNKERPESIDWDKLQRCVDNFIRQKKNIIIEGHLIFTNVKLCLVLTHMVTIVVSKDVAKIRRQQSSKPVTNYYFEAVVWPSFIRYDRKDKIASFKIDGEREKNEILQAALDYIRGSLAPVLIPHTEDQEVIKFVRSICGSSQSMFNMPCNLTLQILKDISMSPAYRVAPKIDGVRHLMASVQGKMFLIKRNLEVDVIADSPVTFVLDVEVLDKVVVILDVIAVPTSTGYMSVIDYPMRERLQKFASYLSVLEGLIVDKHVKFQEYSGISNIKRVLNKKGRYDGLVFVSFNSHFKAQTVYKWKSKSECTVDFCVRRVPGPYMVNGIQITDRPALGLELLRGGSPYIFAVLEGKESYPDGTIVECSYKYNRVLKRRKWEVVRVREDKNVPNSYEVAMASIKPLSESTLVSIVERYGISRVYDHELK